MNSDRSLLHFAGAALLAGSAALLGTLGCQSKNTSSEEGSVGTSRAAVATQKVYVGVRAQGRHTCGLLADGTMNCFGEGYTGEAKTLVGKYSDVSLGEQANCALRSADHSVVCWGYTPELGDDPSEKFKKLSVQGRYACGIRDDDSIQCFGTDSGNGEVANQAGKYKDVAAGYNHVCALTSEGGPICWGNDDFYQAEPPAVADTYERIVAGYGFTCGITTTEGLLRCWGTGASVPVSVSGVTPFVDIAANSDSVCVLDQEGRAGCYGLVDTQTTTQGLKSIAVGQGYACAVTATGGIECWGNSGDYSVEVSGAVSQVSAGGQNTCILRPNKKLQCWGDESYGLYDPPADDFKAVAVGEYFACAIYDADGTLYCYGDGSAGQGNVPPGTFTKVGAEGNTACALATDGSIACWGAGGDITSPTGSSFVTLDVGTSHACGIDSSGAVSCWGEDWWGETAAPTTGQYTSVAIGYDTACAVAKDKSLLCWGHYADTKPGPYTAISIRGDDFCAIRGDGKLECWYYGEGSGTYDVPADTFKSVDTTCGVRSDGELACFGYKARNFGKLRVRLSPDWWFSFSRYQPVNTQLTAAGGTAPHTFKASSAAMPPGLMITSSGLLKGSPSSFGEYGPTLLVTDASGLTDEVSLFFNVSDPGFSLVYESGDKQSAYVGDAFAKPLVLRVSTEGNSSDVPVSFAGPNLKFEPPSVLTDSTGRASVTVTATGSAGPRKVWATVGGVATPVIFELTAKAYPSLVNIQTDATEVRQGERVTVSTTVDSDGDATGKTYFYVDDELYCIKELTTAAASCKLLMKADGEHQLSVKYLGDGRNSAAVSETLTVSVAHDPNYVPPANGEGGAGGAENGSGGSSSGGSSTGGSHTGGSSNNEAGAPSEDVNKGDDSSGSSGCSYTAGNTANGQAWAMLLGGVALAGAVRRRRAV